jgi:hypothetical protein
MPDGAVQHIALGQQLPEAEPGHVLAARLEEVLGCGIHVVNGQLPVHEHHGRCQQIETVERAGNHGAKSVM